MREFSVTVGMDVSLSSVNSQEPYHKSGRAGPVAPASAGNAAAEPDMPGQPGNAKDHARAASIKAVWPSWFGTSTLLPAWAALRPGADMDHIPYHGAP